MRTLGASDQAFHRATSLGVLRYFVTQSALIRGYFPVARNSITAIAFVLGSLVSIVFGMVVAGTRG